MNGSTDLPPARRKAADVGMDPRSSQPSTFASRRAVRGPDERPQRLISLGVEPIRLAGARSSDPGQVVPIQFVVDADDSSKRYRRLVPNGTLEPMFATRGGEDEHERLGQLSPSVHNFRSGTWPSAPSDPPPVPIVEL